MRDVASCSSCPFCSQPYMSWAQHKRQHPECSPCSLSDIAGAPVVTQETCDASFVDATLLILQDQVARDLMDLRYLHGLSEPDIQHVKEAARRWTAEIGQVALTQLLEAGFIAPGVDDKQLQAKLKINIFDGLETKAQEYAAAKRDLPYQEPRLVHPDGDGKGEPIVSLDMAQLYFRRLQHDSAFRKKIIKKSDELKTGAKFEQLPDKLNDILDGVAARWHPHIHRPATPDERSDVRIVQLEQVDDLEICNALGVARNTHKQCGVQVACLSLPAEERFTMDNIMLPVLARASVYKKHGMARVLAGVDQSGHQHDEPCHVKDMQALDKGVWGYIPDDERGGDRLICLKVWTLTISADDPAKKSLTPFVESCSAHRHCNVCTYHAKGVNAKPSSLSPSLSLRASLLFLSNSN